MSKAILITSNGEVREKVQSVIDRHELDLVVITKLGDLRSVAAGKEPLLYILDPAVRNGKKFIAFFQEQHPPLPALILADGAQMEQALKPHSGFHGALPVPLAEGFVEYAVRNALSFRTLYKEKGEDLDESLLNYYTVVEQTHEGIVIVQKGRIVFTNSRFARIIHFSPDEILDAVSSVFFPPEIEEQISKIEKEGLVKKEPKYFESNILTKEGKIIPIDVNIQETVFNKEPSTIVFLEDITERKKLQTQLIHTSNLAAIGQIAIGLAHDINTPLANISLLSENISAHTDDEFIISKLETMDKQVDIITNIIKNLLSVYRRSREMYSDLNINEVILDTLNISKDLILHDLEMELHFDDDLPFVMGNPEQLGQVFLNMILNSDDSMADHGMLVIRTFFDDQFVYVEFKDNGCGIPEDKLYSIFDPFYTTKKPNKGVGLGLSICQGIIHSHNGKIDVKSKPGEGTTFTVILKR